MSRQNDRGRGNATLLTVVIDGKSVKINPASIDKSDRKVLHGEYKGTQVNSPAMCSIGDSIVFWPQTDKEFAVAMPKPTFGVLSSEFLRTEGYTVNYQR